MASSGNGAQNIAAAAILGLCVLGAAFLVSRSLGQASEDITLAMAEIQGAVEEGAPAAPAARPPQRRRGPDPNKVHDVNVKDSPAKGGENASVTVVEFSDFQCPFCARVGPTLKQIEEAYPEEVRIVFKHLPLSMHPQAAPAASAAEAARLQGKFWEMHDKIFANQREMSPEKYLAWAGELGLDVDRFKKDMESKEVLARVQADAREASSLGVSGTPAFFVNGRYLSGALPFDQFKAVIERELKKS